MKGCTLPGFLGALSVLLQVAVAGADSNTDPGTVVTTVPPMVTVLASDPNASEDGIDPGTFAISRTGGVDQSVIVYYTLSGTAFNGLDYKILPGFATIPAGTNAVNVTVTPIKDNDRAAATSDTVVMQLHPPVDFLVGNGPSYSLGWPSNAVVTIAETSTPRTNQPPVVRLVNPVAASGYVAPANIRLVAQARDADGSVTNVEFFAGAASLGSVSKAGSSHDGLGLSTLNWTNAPAGSYSLTAKGTDDSGASTVSSAVSIRILAEAEIPLITVAASDADASELGPDNGTFTVTRTGDTTAALAVYYSLRGTAKNGTDYMRLPGIVNFAAGAGTTNITVVPIADVDSTLQTNDTVELQLQPLVDLRPGLQGIYRLGSPSNAVVTIKEDPTAVPVVTVTATDATASEDGPDTGVFEVARTGNSSTALTVYYSLGGGARNGRDYKTLPGYVTLASGATKTNITVTPILDIDTTTETNETVVLQLRSLRDPVGGRGTPYLVGWPSNAVVTVAESTVPRTNHPPVVHLLSPGDGAGYVAPATVTLTAQARDTDGTVTNVEFFAGNTSLGKVSAPSSHARDSFSLKWTNIGVGQYFLTAVANDNGGASSTSGPVHIVVTKTALPVVTISVADSLAITGTNAMGKTNLASVVVRRTGGTDTDLIVYYGVSGSASNGVDYVKVPGATTIPMGKRSATIMIEAIQGPGTDRMLNAVFTLQSPPVSDQNPPAYLLGKVRSAAVLIVDRPAALGSGGVRSGTFYMPLQVPAGVRSWLERSYNLVDWELIGANDNPQGSVPVIDPGAPTAAQSFYRVVPDTDDQP